MSNDRGSFPFLPVASIIALAASLPLPWMTIRNGEVTSSVPGLFEGFSGMTFVVTGINGKITTLGFECPIWLVVTLGLFAAVLSIEQVARSISAPRAASIILFFVAGLYVVAALVTGFNPDATIGVGSVAALVGISLGLFHAIFPRASMRPATSAAAD